jgi:hypothetical protein
VSRQGIINEIKNLHPEDQRASDRCNDTEKRRTGPHHRSAALTLEAIHQDYFSPPSSADVDETWLSATMNASRKEVLGVPADLTTSEFIGQSAKSAVLRAASLDRST